jgi:hypothetical protein
MTFRSAGIEALGDSLEVDHQSGCIGQRAVGRRAGERRLRVGSANAKGKDNERHGRGEVPTPLRTRHHSMAPLYAKLSTANALIGCDGVQISFAHISIAVARFLIWCCDKTRERKLCVTQASTTTLACTASAGEAQIMVLRATRDRTNLRKQLIRLGLSHKRP